MNGTTKKSVGALTVVLVLVGGVAMLGTGTVAAFAGTRQISPSGGHLQAQVQGVAALDMTISAADVTVEFSGDVHQAKLQIEAGSVDGWSLKRDGDRLKVRGPQRGLGWFQPDWFTGDQRATLLLPIALKDIDADLTLQAGALSVDGAFHRLHLKMNAGSLSVSGSATNLDAELNAGRADIDLSGVTTADYTVNAGRMTSVLSTVPDKVGVSVSAGELDLTVPQAEYDLRRNVTAGSIDSRLTERAGSGHDVSVNVSAGSVTLREK